MSRRTDKNVGVIGLGIIGQRVADCLRRRHYHVFVWNRTPKPFPNFVGSPAEIAQLCDFVQIFVSDDEALLEMVQQMKQSLKAHHVIIAHSTVAPATMRAAAEIVQRRGAQFLDAPFTGSKIPAEKGELVYYVGGDDSAFRRARPVLEASSKEIIEIGEIGQATAIKVATNMITAATVQAAAEALALVHSSGIPLDKFVTAMRGNAANSGTLQLKLPKMVAGDFEPHFSVKHMLKDVQIATRMARSHGLVLGATEASREALLQQMGEGRGDVDYSAVLGTFFPDGPPGAVVDERAEAEEQADFEGLSDSAAAQKVDEREEERTPAPEPVVVEEPAVDAASEPQPELIANGAHRNGDEPTREIENSADAISTEGQPIRSDDELPLSEGDQRITEISAEPEELQAEQEATPTPALAVAEREPLEAAKEADPEAEENERRGFFRRMFSKLDY